MPKPGRKQPATAPPTRAVAATPRRVWKLEDAKARFSEVVQLALSEGPQRVTRRGRPAVLVVADEGSGDYSPGGSALAPGWADQLRGCLSDDTDLMALIGPREKYDRGGGRNPLAKLLGKRRK